MPKHSDAKPDSRPGRLEGEMPLFHLLRPEEWVSAQSARAYAPPSLGLEGFIHLSTGRQVLKTANRFFAGMDDLLVLAVDRSRLTAAALRFERVDGEDFPHLYGPLNLDAVIEVMPLAASRERFRVD